MGIIDFVGLLSVMIDAVTHKHMFYSGLQLKTYWDLLAWVVEQVVKHEQVLESEEPATNYFWSAVRNTWLDAGIWDLQQEPSS